MADEHADLTNALREIAGQPLSAEAQAAHDRIMRAFVDSLPDAEGTFGGHLITAACYRLGGCGPDCPPAIRVDAARLEQD